MFIISRGKTVGLGKIKTAPAYPSLQSMESSIVGILRMILTIFYDAKHIKLQYGLHKIPTMKQIFSSFKFEYIFSEIFEEAYLECQMPPPDKSRPHLTSKDNSKFQALVETIQRCNDELQDLMTPGCSGSIGAAIVTDIRKSVNVSQLERLCGVSSSYPMIHNSARERWQQLLNPMASSPGPFVATAALSAPYEDHIASLSLVGAVNDLSLVSKTTSHEQYEEQFNEFRKPKSVGTYNMILTGPTFSNSKVEYQLSWADQQSDIRSKANPALMTVQHPSYG
jgi:hypothetical protein